MTPRPAQKRQKDPPAQPQSSGVPSLSPGTTRVLPMQLQVGDRLADETSEAHVRVQRVNQPAGAKFCLECGEPVAPQATAEPRFTSPEAYTPKHLAEKILASKAALEGERRQVTVLFADLKGSMELLADRDPPRRRCTARWR